VNLRIRKITRILWYVVWYSVAAFIILLAAVFGMLRLLLPLVGDYNQDIEKYAQNLVGRPIKIMSLDAEWHGFSPSLVLKNVRFLSLDGKQTLLQVSRVRLDFDLYMMARTSQVQFRRFGLSGANISLVRTAQGAFALAGFENNSIEPQQGSAESGGVINWLLSQGEISLHARNFIFTDHMNHNRKYHFSNLGLVLRNDADRHLIDGAVEFADTSGEEFTFAMDVTGDIRKPNEWSAKVYAHGANLDLSSIVGPVALGGNKFQVGKSDFEFWSDWDKAVLTGLQGQVSLNKINIRTEDAQSKSAGEHSISTGNPASIPPEESLSQSIQYDRVSARFNWNIYEEGWRVQADNVSVERDQRVWPSSQINLQYIVDKNEGKLVKFQSGFLRISDIVPLAPRFLSDQKEYLDLLRNYQPSGDIGNLNFEWREKENRFGLSANVKRVSVNSVERFPGFSGLTGDLRISNHSGSFEFNTRNSVLHLPKVFREELPVSRITGKVDWFSDDKGLSVSSRNIRLDTPEFQSEAVFDLDVPVSASTPFLSLITQFKNGDAGHVSRYYPYPVMSVGALKWLDRAFIQGEIVSGGAIFYGPVNEFPFTQGQGVFDVRFNASNVTLDYAAGWPELKKADANVVFRGSSLNVTSKHAKILDSGVSNIKVSIADFAQSALNIKVNGVVTGKTQDKLRYLLTAPPLKAKYEKGIADLRATGSSELDLDLGLVIGKEVNADVKGLIKINNNSLELVQVPELLDSINGEITFDNANFSGKNIKANLLKQPVTMAVNTRKFKSRGTVAEISATGMFNAKEITRLRFPLFYDMVDGDADWLVKFQIPERNTDPILVVDTNLRGISLNLPDPFKKEKSDVRKLTVSTSFREGSRGTLKVSYAGIFEGILEKDYTREIWLRRGEVRFGGGPAVMPVDPGLRIAGDMEFASYDVWDNLIHQLIEINRRQKSENKAAVQLPSSAGDTESYFTLVSNIDLNVRNFEIFGQKDTNARIKMENKQTWLAINVESTNYSGNIKVPDDLEKKALVLDMSRMNITPLESSGGRIDPRKLPALKLNSRTFNYGDKKLGQVAVETAKQPDGLIVQQLIVKPRSTVIKGHGSWKVTEESDEAHLELAVDSEDVGKTMKDLGYVDTIADGKGTLSAKLSWPASLLDPDLAQIAGEVSFNMQNGRILDIEPGKAARLFGLFSIQTLPRRLMLDFSDIFSKGLRFDVIKGDFNIEHGDAYTTNVQLIGPNADVLLKGRIGIGAQDYDQRIKVTPHITDTTILLSIITSQPLLLLFQQLLKQDIDAATSFEYLLTGKWENYILTPVVKVVPPSSFQDDL